MSLRTRCVSCTYADPQDRKCWGLLFPYLIFIAFFWRVYFAYSRCHTYTYCRLGVLTYRTSTAELVVILITTVIRKASTFWRSFFWCVLTWRSILGFFQNMLWLELSVCFNYICDRDRDIQIPSLSIAFIVFAPLRHNAGHGLLIHEVYTGLFISPSGISELDCATTKTDTAERSISIGRESLQVFLY